MAVANVAVVANKKGGNIDLYFSANGFALCTGNSTTSNVNGSSVCSAINEEIINSMSIREATYSCSNNSGFWTVARGSNAYFTFGTNDGVMDFAASGEGFGLDATANLVVTFTGGGSGFLILKMRKQSSYTQPE